MNLSFIKKWFSNKSEKQDHEEKHDEKQSDTSSNESARPANENYHAVIGRMSAFFAHEIRNPLTSIIGFAEFMEQHPAIKADPNIAHYTSIIREEALKMELLIQELLSLSKSHLDHDNLSIIDVKQSVNKIITIYTMKADKQNITFQTHIEEDVYITGNASRFERMIINLINNAIEAIQEEGTIEIRIVKEHKHVYISIIDSGPGIDPDQLEQIFYPFYTTKDEGTGIGLPICKTIVETLNGTMDITNHPTKGVHVKMKIPYSEHATRNN